MKVRELLDYLHSIAPPSIAEEWDNVGLQVGSHDADCGSVAVALDVWPDTVRAAAELGCSTVVAHHPLIFRPVRRVTAGDLVSDAVRELVKRDMNLITAHTNLDFALVSRALALKCGAASVAPLMPVEGAKLSKLVVFVPVTHAQRVLDAMFEAGAGNIGEYSNCSFAADGTGTFKGSDHANPFIGEPGKLESCPERRLEVVLPTPFANRVVAAARAAHPYEEMAYDLYDLANRDPRFSHGVVGIHEPPLNAAEFVEQVKQALGSRAVKVSGYRPELRVRKVGYAGGSAFDAWKAASGKGCAAFVVGECRYHDHFQPAVGGPMVIEVGHGESEYPVVAVLARMLVDRFPALHIHPLPPQFPTETL